MSFKKPVLPVLEPLEGYNRLHKDYKQWHKHLDSFDKGLFKRMLPRSLDGLDILELWAGDGRVFAYFKNVPFNRYVASDFAEALLKRHPGTKGVEKSVCNLEQPLPYGTHEFDLVLTFFVFEHIDNLRELFSEVQRVLKPAGSWVVGHFLHRREFTFKDNKGEFKIRHNKRKFEQLEEFAEWAFLEHSFVDVIEKGNLLGRIYKFENN